MLTTRLHLVLLMTRAMLLTVGVAAPAFAQRRPEFAVAEVRADGLLLPVAKWDGTRWHALTLTKPDSVPYFAPGGEWHYVAFSGARARLVPGDAVHILTDDEDQWGFTTNLVPRRFDSPPALSQRVGVATSDSVPLRLFTTATPREKSLARAAMRQLLDSLWKAVLDSVRNAGERPPAPPAADSFTFSATVVRLSDDTTLMNAFAKLPVSTLAGVSTCAIIAAYDGFVILAGERVIFQKTQTPFMSDCDMKELKAEDPHALFQVAGRTFVFARRVYWEWSEPVIYEWRDSQLSLVFQRDP